MTAPAKDNEPDEMDLICAALIAKRAGEILKSRDPARGVLGRSGEKLVDIGEMVRTAAVTENASKQMRKTEEQLRRAHGGEARRDAGKCA